MQETEITGREGEKLPEERITEIEVERLRDFRNHPFRISAGKPMEDLMESIDQAEGRVWMDGLYKRLTAYARYLQKLKIINSINGQSLRKGPGLVKGKRNRNSRTKIKNQI